MAAGVALGICSVHATAIGNDLSLNSSKAFGVAHYLMLGANEKTIGVYDDADVDFSSSFNNKSERRNAQIKETARRYKEMGVRGTLALWGRKNMLNFSDGTFLDVIALSLIFLTLFHTLFECRNAICSVSFPFSSYWQWKDAIC